MDMTTSERVEFLSRSPAETKDVGRRLAQSLRPGAVLALYGELGTGKTVFCKGIATGLGLRDDRLVTSPTFTLIHIYPTNPPLRHIDLYRLSEAEALALGPEELFAPEAICAIEWAEKLGNNLPPGHVKVVLKYVSNSERSIEILRPAESAR